MIARGRKEAARNPIRPKRVVAGLPSVENRRFSFEIG